MQPIVVTTSDASNGTVYSRKVRMDSWADPVSIIQLNVTGTATVTVEGSMDDPNSETDPVAEGSMTWINCSAASLVAANANVQGILTATPTFLRLKQTAGNGSVRMTVAQFGNATY